MTDATARLAYPPGTVVIDWYGRPVVVTGVHPGGMVGTASESHVLLQWSDGAPWPRYVILAKGKVRANPGEEP